jgi:hypothetical protein
LSNKASSDLARFRTCWEVQRDCAECLGVLELLEEPPLFVSLVLGTAIVATREIDAVPNELVFALSAEDLSSRLASLRLRLLSPDGKTAVNSGMAMLHAETLQSRKLDADGRVEFAGMLPGGYELTLSSSGSMQQRQIVLEPGQVLDLGDVTPSASSAARLLVRFAFPSEEQPPVQFVLEPESVGSPLNMIGSYPRLSFSSQATNPAEMSFPGAGAYELRVTRVGDPRGESSLHLGARPQRVVLGDAPAREIVVQIVPSTEVCIRLTGGARGISRWLVSTTDGLPCQRVRVEGRLPNRIELAPGEYTIARIDPDTKALGKPQAFTVGSSFFTLDLQP